MAFFRTMNFSEPMPSVAGDGIVLRAPQITDHGEWAALRELSRDFLTPWEPLWAADELTRAGLLPAPGTRDELARTIAEESKTWGKVIADRKITAE